MNKAFGIDLAPRLQDGGPLQPVILVVDDDVMVGNLVTILMQLEGYLVLAASDGQEGLELSRQYGGRIDLVITDMEMPRLNGNDLCAHLLEERPGIKLLIMSGADIAEIVEQNIHLAFLPKPFDGETIKRQVRTILGLPQKLPEVGSSCGKAEYKSNRKVGTQRNWTEVYE